VQIDGIGGTYLRERDRDRDRERERERDVSFLLSALHHFFLGYFFIIFFKRKLKKEN